MWLFAVERTLNSSVENQLKTVGVFIWKTTRLCSKHMQKCSLYQALADVWPSCIPNSVQLMSAGSVRTRQFCVCAWLQLCNCILCFFCSCVELFAFPINVFYAWERLLAFHTWGFLFFFFNYFPLWGIWFSRRLAYGWQRIATHNQLEEKEKRTSDQEAQPPPNSRHSKRNSQYHRKCNFAPRIPYCRRHNLFMS